MRIAVVTPTHRVPSPWLEQCLASVAGQSYPCTHVLVADGDEALRVDDSVVLIRTTTAHCDFGNAARGIGALYAAGCGFQAIAFLDPDCWYDREHLERLVALEQRTCSPVLSSGRILWDRNGRRLGESPQVNGDRYVDPSCLMLTRRAYPALLAWLNVPKEQKHTGGARLWGRIRQSGVPRAHDPRPSVHSRISTGAGAIPKPAQTRSGSERTGPTKIATIDAPPLEGIEQAIRESLESPRELDLDPGEA